MLKQGFVLEIIVWTDYYQKEKQKKVIIGLMTDELSGKSWQNLLD